MVNKGIRCPAINNFERYAAKIDGKVLGSVFRSNFLGTTLFVIFFSPSLTAQLMIDADGDSIEDRYDNCISEINPDQSDIDKDGIGDICDKDCLMLLQSEVFFGDEKKSFNLSKSIVGAIPLSFSYSLVKSNEVILIATLSEEVDVIYYLRKNGLVVDKSKSIDKKITFKLGLQPAGNYSLEIIAVGAEGIAVGVDKLEYFADYSFLAGSTKGTSMNIPIEFDMLQNYPNPFSNTTHIPFELPKACHVRIRLYKDIKAAPITTITDADYPPGFHSVFWDVTSIPDILPSGQYLYSIEAGDFKYVKKMIRLIH
jgi:hypothetical protein